MLTSNCIVHLTDYYYYKLENYWINMKKLIVQKNHAIMVLIKNLSPVVVAILDF